MRSAISKNPRILLVLVIAAMAGCQTIPYQGTARDVKRKPQLGGVIAIPSNPRPEDRAKAETLMKGNCQDKKLVLLEEGEVQIGVETTTQARQTDRASSERQVGQIFGVPLVSGEAAGNDTRSTSQSRNAYEWQIQYECQAAVAAPGLPTATSGKSKSKPK